ncbi:MAG TPA: DUF6445 family protein, partial [Anaerovoracaceae bacterium]|nr:DUF6445 family protein [Anaerovoracaceae bacterium]
KEFSVLETPLEFLPYFQLPGHEIVLTFIRNAYKGFDDKWRIHADNFIDGHKTSFASVLYINNEEGVTPNGTAFWKHHAHGHRLPDDISKAEFDRLLLEDSNELSKWQQTGFIGSVPNRLLVYDSQMFHSKTPNEITEGTRIVLVTFYKKSTL